MTSCEPSVLYMRSNSPSVVGVNATLYEWVTLDLSKFYTLYTEGALILDA